MPRAHPSRPPAVRRRAAGALALSSLLLVGACSGSDGTTAPTTAAGPSGAGATTAAAEAVTTSGAAATGSAPTTVTATTGAAGTLAGAGFYDATTVHTVAVTFDQAAYDAMITTFTSTGDKSWIEADVTIDGTTYARAGLRLKGNSSLSGLRRPAGAGGAGGGAPGGGDAGRPGPAVAGGGPGGNASADTPEKLPWLVRLDKYVDDQNHQGLTELVVRSSNTATAMNEAVSLALLGQAGLATQRAVAVRFTVNDRPTALRLVIENPNDDWAEAELGDGPLYKADAEGDYSYRGADPAAYADAWDQDAGDDDLAPLVSFLDFVNNSDDATFAARLPERLDVDAFARYLALEDLLQNFDDISGPGNNSYLYYDPATTKMTVVAWDHNLALNAMGPGGGRGFPGARDGAGGGFPGGAPPAGGNAAGSPAGGPPAGGGGFPGGGRFGRANKLVERFEADTTFKARYDAAYAELRAELYGSGFAQGVLDRWSALLTAQATDLVPAATIAQEATSIGSFFTAS